MRKWEGLQHAAATRVIATPATAWLARGQEAARGGVRWPQCTAWVMSRVTVCNGLMSAPAGDLYVLSVRAVSDAREKIREMEWFAALLGEPDQPTSPQDVASGLRAAVEAATAEHIQVESEHQPTLQGLLHVWK